MNNVTQNMRTSVKFINHASVIISGDGVSILSDPWFFGDAFHKGWNLLYELDHDEILKILNEITHIWISHEHPDHFSIPFFKRYIKFIKERNIIILFQKTIDQRVYKFLKNLELDVHELDYDMRHNLSENYSITCIKDGFYDSALFIECYGEKILNLNDCDVKSVSAAKKIYSITGKIDVLLSQFSYAAWKGGVKNKKWRLEAAAEKIKTLRLQVDIFCPKFFIPFASYFLFSNIENFYLNDAVNKPDYLSKLFDNCASKILIMAPNDILGGKNEVLDEIKALNFWKKKYLKVNSYSLNQYKTVSFDELKKNFFIYCKRIKKNNSVILIKFLRSLKIFCPVVVNIIDLNLSLKFDYIKEFIEETNEKAMISMKSESLNFIFKNAFGFDTLTVNGCFEECHKGGFVKATKSLAIENLNNLGIKIEIKTFFKFSIIKLFLVRLYRVASKLNT